MTTQAATHTLGARSWRKKVYEAYLEDFYAGELADGMTLREALRRDYEAAGSVDRMIDGGLFEVYYDDVRRTLTDIHGEKLINKLDNEALWHFYRDELGMAIFDIMTEGEA